MMIFRVGWCGAAALVFVFAAMVMPGRTAQTPAPTPSATDLDPKVLAYKLPDQVSWKDDDPMGPKTAVLQGDPSKAGFTSCWSNGLRTT